jgi:hypothetical protein
MIIVRSHRGNAAPLGAASRWAPSRQPNMPLLAELEDNLNCVTINRPLLKELALYPWALECLIRPSAQTTHVAMKHN